MVTQFQYQPATTTKLQVLHLNILLNPSDNNVPAQKNECSGIPVT